MELIRSRRRGWEGYEDEKETEQNEEEEDLAEGTGRGRRSVIIIRGLISRLS